MEERLEGSNRALKMLTMGFFGVVLVSNAIFLLVSVVSPALGGMIVYKIDGIANMYIATSFAAAIALLVVLSLRYVAGEIEFEAIGFKFKGASGPVVLWVLCFLAVVVGLYALKVSAAG